MQPRTLEIYNFLGVLPEILAATMSAQPLVMYEADGVSIKAEVGIAQDVESTPSKPYVSDVRLTCNDVLCFGMIDQHALDWAV